ATVLFTVGLLLPGTVGDVGGFALAVAWACAACPENLTVGFIAGGSFVPTPTARTTPNTLAEATGGACIVIFRGAVNELAPPVDGPTTGRWRKANTPIATPARKLQAAVADISHQFFRVCERASCFSRI
ncbi:MAG: hypothetical protein ACP5I8_15865, partial [Phycisphaerae bacterium]